MEAQRYPDDFDGIVAAAPAMDWPGIAAAFVRNSQAAFPDPSTLDHSVITRDNLKLLESRSFSLAERISRFRQRGEPAFSKEDVRRALFDD